MKDADSAKKHADIYYGQKKHYKFWVLYNLTAGVLFEFWKAISTTDHTKRAELCHQRFVVMFCVIHRFLSKEKNLDFF